MKDYFTNLINQNNVKSIDPSKLTDLKKLYKNLSLETHWNNPKKPQESTVQLYAIKKHMMDEPQLQDLSLMNMTRCDLN